jgi:membrane protein DedA with SNARE-associated domain
MNTSILLGLALGTLVSEDLASISAGLLARDGAVGLAPAIAACVAGVYLGDLGLWALGRALGRRVLRPGWVAGRVDAATLASVGRRLDDRLGLAVLGSRFLPGSRLPMYLALGVCGQRPLAFVAWSLLAVVIWTPALVWLTYIFGASATAPLVGELNGVLRSLLSAVILFAVWQLTTRVFAVRLSSRS